MDLHSLVFAGNCKELERILTKDASQIESKNSFGFTALHLACSLGNVEIVGLLLKCNANVHALTTKRMSTPLHIAAERKSTPLHIAAEYGKEKVVSRLLQELGAADIVKGDHEEDTVLHVAACNGNVDILKQLYDKRPGNPDLDNAATQTPLFYAAGMGNLEAVKFLLDRGADKAHTDDAGLTPFHLSAKQGNSNVMDLLKLPNINVKSSKGFTALHYASWNGHKDAVRWLLNEGGQASLEEKDNEKQDTALHLAARKGSWDVAKILVEAGANICARNKNGETPLCLADKLNHGNFICAALRSSIGKEDVNPLAADHNGVTLLHYAAAYGTTEDVKSVIDKIISKLLSIINKGVDLSSLVNIKDKQGRTAMHWAAEYGNVKVIEILSKSKVELMYKDGKQRTPLSCALMRGHLEFAEKLIIMLGDVKFATWIKEWAQEMMESLKCDEKLVNKINSPGLPVSTSVEDVIGSMPPLWVAFKIGREKVANFIANKCSEMGVKDIINQRDDKTKRTALHWATILEDKDTVANLCKFKEEALADIEDKSGKTAFQYSVEMGLEDIKRELMNLNDVKACLKRLNNQCKIYVDGSNAILIGAALIASITFEACIRPPLSPKYSLLKVFWMLNILSFFFAIAAIIIRAAAVFCPRPRIYLGSSVTFIRLSLLLETVCFGFSLFLLLGAFLTATFIVRPTLFEYKHISTPAWLRTSTVITSLGVAPCILCFMFFLYFIGLEFYRHYQGKDGWSMDVFQIRNGVKRNESGRPQEEYQAGDRYEDAPWEDGLDDYPRTEDVARRMRLLQEQRSLL